MNATFGKQNIEEVMTFEEWERIYNRKKKQENAKKIYFIKQKATGLLFVFIGVLIPFVFKDDASFSLLAIPLGLLLTFTRQKILDFK